MPRLFELQVEEDLSNKKAQQILEDLEEVLGKHGLSLDYAQHELT